MTDFRNNTKSFWDTSSALVRILLINVAIFLVIRIVNAFSGLFQVSLFSFESVSSWLAIPSALGKLLLKPWTIITYMFYHWDFMHILINMLWLNFMGSIIMEFLGGKKLVNIYLLGGIAGGILYVIAFNTFPLFKNSVDSSFALGASAGVLAIVMAAATLLPDKKVNLLLIGSISLKWIAAIAILTDLISVSGSNAGGHISHLGGALMGFLYIRQLQKGRNLGAWIEAIFRPFSGKSSRMRVAHRRGMSDEDYNVMRRSKQEQMDEILDKINKSGYGSLTQAEKDFLFQMSKENK